MSKSLLDAFEIEKEEKVNDIPNDYEIFPDKTLLDNIRTKIIENIID